MVSTCITKYNTDEKIPIKQEILHKIKPDVYITDTEFKILKFLYDSLGFDSSIPSDASIILDIMTDNKLTHKEKIEFLKKTFG